MTGDEIARFLYFSIFLAAIAGGYFFRREIMGREMLRHAGIWALVVLVLLGAYALRDEIGAELRPSAAISVAEGEVELRRSAGGQFEASAEVGANGRERQVRFLVDTGASHVVLSPADARRLGFDLDRLAFGQAVATANGRTFAARARLDVLRVGDVEVRNVEAFVQRDGLDRSLLGMSFLDRIEGYSVSRDVMVLRK